MGVNTKLQVILEQMNNLKQQAFRVSKKTKKYFFSNFLHFLFKQKRKLNFINKLKILIFHF